jgi:catechol 2,3-dioxygenase-like lactoylglutathione lyase family enzyme
MAVEGLTPILNVSDLPASFRWFEQLGWKPLWAYGDPPDFGAVGFGTITIFLCLNAQGSRGGPLPRFVGDDLTGGVWMSWWVSTLEEVDTMHALALQQGMTVAMPPTNEPWGVREFHLRHPDGHTFRIGAGICPEE